MILENLIETHKKLRVAYWEKLTRKSRVHVGSINTRINRNGSWVTIGNGHRKETCPNYLVFPLGSISTSLTLTNFFTTKYLRNLTTRAP